MFVLAQMEMTPLDKVTDHRHQIHAFPNPFFFAILDMSHLAVVEVLLDLSLPSSIQIYRFAPLREETEPGPPPQTLDPATEEPICSLRLPPQDAPNTFTSVSSFTCNAYRPSTAPEQIAFHPDEASAMLSMCIVFIRREDGIWTHHTLLIPLRTIRREIARADALGHATTSDWTDWGPHGSAFLHMPASPAGSSGFYEAFGHRYGMLVYDDPPSLTAAQVVILDFSPATSRPRPSSDSEPLKATVGERVDLLARRSISQGSWEERFAASVRSTLPYNVVMGPRVVLPQGLRAFRQMLMQPDGFTLIVSAMQYARLPQRLLTLGPLWKASRLEYGQHELSYQSYTL